MNGPRRALWSALCALLYWSGIGAAAAWLWRRGSRAEWTIVAYHRIGHPTRGGGPEWVAPERFRRHLKAFRRRYEVVPVGEALDILRDGRIPRRPLLSVTFDDGYEDNVSVALPILLEEGCRATLYPTLEAIEEGLPPWPHRLAEDLEALAAAAAGDSRGAGEPGADPIDWFAAGSHGLSPAALSRRVGAVVGMVKRLPDDERRQVCERAARRAGPGAARERRMLTPDELRRWSRSGMEVGSHTWRHPVLSRVEAPDRRADLARSRQGLETTLGIPVVHLAYPNGRSGDWDADVIDDARRAGFASAVTTLEGCNRSASDPYALRRVSVPNDSVPVLLMRISPPVAWLKSRLARRAPAKMAARPRPGAAVPAGRPLRIAFIGGRGIGSAYSGIERYYEEVGTRLVARGHRVLAYCRPHFTPEGPRYRGLEIRRLPTIRSKHLETFVHSVLATIDVCFRRVDLVQFHALGSSPLAWIPRLAGKRVVVSVRGLDWQRAKWGWIARTYLKLCEVTAMRCPDATAVVSRKLQRHFEARFGRRVRYIPNGVGRMESRPAEGIGRWGLGPRDYFLYAGRLSPEKRLDLLIEAHRGVPGARLALAGGSSYSDGYVSRLRSVAGDSVVFTGFQTGALLEELYSNALAFVLPSTMEGLSVALLEAMAYGLPVIASDIPENRELVDACGGYLFRLDDVADLRRVMAQVRDAPEAALRLGARAREAVHAGFGWDRIAEKTEEFYQEVMAGSFRGPADPEAPVLPKSQRPAVPAPADPPAEQAKLAARDRAR